jgi:hypothetical protein
MAMENNIGKEYLSISIQDFKNLKKLAEKAMEQLEPNDYHWQPDKESNSIAVLIKHLSGNMISRSTDFLTTDGEKPDRNRDNEFIDDIDSVETLMAKWERGWDCLFKTLSSLGEEDLNKTVYIRGEPHSVIKAINRQIMHYTGHIGQIIYISKHLKSETWKTLSIPRGKSADYLPK